MEFLNHFKSHFNRIYCPCHWLLCCMDVWLLSLLDAKTCSVWEYRLFFTITYANVSFASSFFSYRYRHWACLTRELQYCDFKFSNACVLDLTPANLNFNNVLLRWRNLRYEMMWEQNLFSMLTISCRFIVI